MRQTCLHSYQEQIQTSEQLQAAIRWNLIQLQEFQLQSKTTKTLSEGPSAAVQHYPTNSSLFKRHQ